MNNPRNRWWIRPLLLHSIRSSVRRDLAGVWVYGPVPTGGAILAPNHQSWWDGYLLKEVAAGRGQRGAHARQDLLRCDSGQGEGLVEVAHIGAHAGSGRPAQRARWCSHREDA